MNRKNSFTLNDDDQSNAGKSDEVYLVKRSYELHVVACTNGIEASSNCVQDNAMLLDDQLPIGLLAPASYIHRDHIPIFNRCIVFTVSVFQFGFQAGISLITYEDIQDIIEEMMACLKNATVVEREVFQKYVDKSRLLQERSGGRSEDASLHSVLDVLHGRGCSKPMKRRACHRRGKL